ncbi:aminotransferase class I/II-fold pyridoxal phosphate-dependent enzyme [Roseibium salinum]|nr:aminotransferase class I/II-fold pyridoxal phosphate-dependent enzyme [Roseibium salinum]
MAANLRGRGWAFRHGALQPGAPALDCFPYEEWARCLRRAARLERTADLQYRNYAGVPVLKQRLASHLAAERGVRARPDQILVTGSMQASLFLISQVLTDPGDDVWLEEPGYLGARTAFHGAGLRIHPLPTDGEGADATRMSTRDGSPQTHLCDAVTSLSTRHAHAARTAHGSSRHGALRRGDCSGR